MRIAQGIAADMKLSSGMRDVKMRLAQANVQNSAERTAINLSQSHGSRQFRAATNIMQDVNISRKPMLSGIFGFNVPMDDDEELLIPRKTKPKSKASRSHGRDQADIGQLGHAQDSKGRDPQGVHEAVAGAHAEVRQQVAPPTYRPAKPPSDQAKF